MTESQEVTEEIPKVNNKGLEFKQNEEGTKECSDE
jgi:hypothetical protein